MYPNTPMILAVKRNYGRPTWLIFFCKHSYYFIPIIANFSSSCVSTIFLQTANNIPLSCSGLILFQSLSSWTNFARSRHTFQEAHLNPMFPMPFCDQYMASTMQIPHLHSWHYWAYHLATHLPSLWHMHLQGSGSSVATLLLSQVLLIQVISGDHQHIARNILTLLIVEPFGAVTVGIGMFAALVHWIIAQAVKLSMLKDQLLGVPVPAHCLGLRYQDQVLYHTSKRAPGLCGIWRCHCSAIH